LAANSSSRRSTLKPSSRSHKPSSWIPSFRELNPTYTNAYLNRSSARRAAGDKPGADADLAKVRELTKMTAK